ncbi:MAG TPA: hypothetical protein PKW90_19465 [Myxococcota bacterium]|nr:hypothetical protein [Myxococcota bacterium]
MPVDSPDSFAPSYDPGTVLVTTGEQPNGTAVGLVQVQFQSGLDGAPMLGRYVEDQVLDLSRASALPPLARDGQASMRAVGTTGSGKAAPADFFTIGASRLGIDPQNVVRVRAGVEVWRIQDPAVFVSQLPDVPGLTWKLLGSAGEGRVWLVPEVEGVAWVHQLHPAGMVLPPRQEVRIHPTGHQSSLPP